MIAAISKELDLIEPVSGEVEPSLWIRNLEIEISPAETGRQNDA
jgi:hypothetical protein